MKRNIVGTIIILSLIVWVPVSCCIHFCIDKRLRAEQKSEYMRMMKMRAPAQYRVIIICFLNHLKFIFIK